MPKKTDKALKSATLNAAEDPSPLPAGIVEAIIMRIAIMFSK